jgi:hypothetical protein
VSWDLKGILLERVQNTEIQIGLAYMPQVWVKEVKEVIFCSSTDFDIEGFFMLPAG